VSLGSRKGGFNGRNGLTNTSHPPKLGQPVLGEGRLLVPFQDAAWGREGQAVRSGPVVFARRASVHQPAIFLRASGSGWSGEFVIMTTRRTLKK
jgi:hypothetical protein